METAAADGSGEGARVMGGHRATGGDALAAAGPSERYRGTTFNLKSQKWQAQLARCNAHGF